MGKVVEMNQENKKSVEPIPPEMEKLLDETMLVIFDRLEKLSKMKNSEISFEESLYFYVDGDETGHRFECYFVVDPRTKQIVLRCINRHDESLEPMSFGFRKSDFKTRIEREQITFWLVGLFFRSELKEEQFEEYFSDKLGFSIFQKCFKVTRSSDGKPYTGAKGERPFVTYDGRYMNQFNGEYCGSQISNLMKYVFKYCKEKYGFELQGGGNLVDAQGNPCPM